MDHETAAVRPPTRVARTMPLSGQNALLESFSAIAEALTSSGDLATVLQCIAEESLHLLHATSARVRMPDATGTQLLLAALADDEEDTRLPPPDPILYLRTDASADKAFRTNQISIARGAPRRGVPEEQYALHCTVPLTTRNRTLGILTIWRTTDEPFSEDEIAILRIFGNAAALAIEQVRLLTEERDRTRRMETLTEISRAISAATDLSTLYEAVRRECGRLFTVESFYIAHVRETTGEVVPDLWYSGGERLRDMEGEPLEGGLSPVVATTRQSLVTDDYIAECKRRDIPIYYPTDPDDVGDAWMGVPLMAGSALLGVIVVNGKRGPYTPEEQDVFTAIANQVSVALTNARLLQEKEVRATRMTALADVSRAISAVTDPDELYDVVYRECNRLLPMANSRICRIVPETGEVFAASYFRNGVRVRELEGRILRGGLSPVIRDTGQPLMTNDYAAELVERGMALMDTPLPPPNSSWLGVPVIQGDEVYGIISLNTTERRLTTEDRDMLLAIANQVGIAMANARLITRERERAARMATLTEVARFISATTDRETLYNAVYAQCARLFHVESLRITRVNAETGEHVPEFWYIDGTRRSEREGIPLRYGLSFIVAERRQPFSTGDYYAERVMRGIPVSKPLNSGTSFEAKAWLGVPMLAGDTLLGVIAIYGKLSAYTPDEQEAFVAIVNQVGVALQNVELIERERTRAERLAILNDISRTISAVLDLEPLLGAIARECMRLVDLRFPLIGYRATSGGWITATGADAIIGHHDKETGVGPLASMVMEKRVPLFVADYETACRERGFTPGSLPGLPPPMGWIGVPMVIGTQVVGVLAGFIPGEHATAENTQLLSIMANQAAIAIENARLYHDAQELGVVEERNRLAREIHDTIAQGLTATTYQLELADTFLAMEPPKLDRAKEKLHRSLELTRANLEEARRSVMDLRAAHLQNVTLTEAFERLAVTFTNDAGVTVTVTAAEDFPALPSPVSAGLYRIGQEALANIAKHAQATRVEMSLGIEESTVVLTIHDDGVGFDPEIVATQRTARGTSGGFGLIGIRERAQLLGGTSDIWSDVGAGTQIVVRVPTKL